MGDRYLTDLADVCRAAGLVVVEVDGWQYRSRGSGGYSSGLPNHVMVHHTASGPGSDPDGDVEYIAWGSDNAPISNLYLSRSGDVYVIAGGATNTNGSGSAPWGGCPDDAMNSHAIGVEAANGGTGEPWPMVQQQAYVTLCAALCDAYEIPVGHVRGHFEWTSRKIDPAGASMWASGAATWEMFLYRDDVLDAIEPDPAPTPTPDTEEYDMAFLIANRDTGEVAVVYGDRQVVGLGGDDVPGYIARFGEPLGDNPTTWAAFVGKSHD